MTDRSYYTSGRFIHDDLVKEARFGLQSIYESWAKYSKIGPFVLAWPETTVDFHGHKTYSVLPFDLPGARKERSATLRKILKEVNAYALLLVEQRDKAVVAIFESPHGTVSWHIPIEYHGDVNSLGDPQEKTDVDSIGLLWAQKKHVEKN